MTPETRPIDEESEKKRILNVLGLCVRWGFPALKPIDSINFNLSTNDK